MKPALLEVRNLRVHYHTSRGEVAEAGVVERCPYAREVCRKQNPPPFQTAERRAVACFLYRESPPLAGAHPERVMAPAVPASR